MSRRRKNWPIILSLAALIVPGLLVWGFYALVNHEGARAWAEMRASLEAEGESLVMDELFPQPIPDKENFFAIPLLNGIGVVDEANFETGGGGLKRARLEAVTYLPEDSVLLKDKPRPSGGYNFGTKADMVAWETYLREAGSLALPEDASGARAILLGLETAHGDVFSGLAEGIDRPRAQMVPSIAELLKQYDTGYGMSVPHYNVMTELTRTLSLRASAAVAAGERETVRETLTILFRINDACRNERSLIAQLVAITHLAIFMQPVWESMEARLWEPEDLRWLIGELEAIDIDEGLEWAMRTEMVTQLDLLEFLKEANAAQQIAMWTGTIPGTGTVGGAVENWMNQWWNLLPDGFFDQNKVTCADWMYRYFVKPMKEVGSLAVIEIEPELRKEIAVAADERKIFSMFARLAVPVYGSICRRIVYIEAVLAQAQAAAALEWYFLDRGAYPRALDDLVPDFLAEIPLDPVSGDPVRYLRYVDGGRCRVWCVGWDGVDDGGKRNLDPKNPEKTKFPRETYVGDWVWSYAP